MGWRGSAISFGGVIWPLVGGILGGFSWRLPFAIYLLGIPLGLLALITMPETHQEKIKDTGENGSMLRVLRKNPLLFAIYGLIFLTMNLIYTIVVFLPQLLEEMNISNLLYISLFLMAMSLSAGLVSFMYGRIKSRLSYKNIVLISLMLWTVGFTTISQAPSGLLIAASVALIGIGQGMVLPAAMVWIGEIVPVSFRGRAVSYFGTFAFIGQFLAPVIFGPVLLSLGFYGIFLVAGGTCAIVFLLFLTALRK